MFVEKASLKQSAYPDLEEDPYELEKLGDLMQRVQAMEEEQRR